VSQTHTCREKNTHTPRETYTVRVDIGVASSTIDFGGSDFTIAGWVNPNDNSAVKTLFSNDNAGWESILLQLNASEQAIFLARCSETGIYVAVEDTTALSGWHHVAGVKSSNTIYLYVDGTQIGSNTKTFGNDCTDNSTRNVIGIDYNGGTIRNAMDGLIDEVAIYDRALSPDEIRTLYQSVAGLNFGNLRLNELPTADAGGSYTIDEGDSLDLNALESSDPDGDTLTFSWDLNGDGTFGDATGPTPTLAWADLVALGIDDDGTFNVAVRVDDGKLGVDTASAILTINNVAPALSIFGADSVAEGSPYTLNLSSSDPGDDTISQWDIKWGDGSDPDNDGNVGEIVSGNPSSVTHVYADGPNTFTITATATDEDGTHPVAGQSGPGDVPVAIWLEAENWDRAGNTGRADWCGQGGWSQNSHLVFGNGFTEYDITFPETGTYSLWLRYAAAGSRPTDIYFDDSLVVDNGAALATGGPFHQIQACDHFCHWMFDL